MFFIQIAGLPAVFKIVHGFNVTQSGLVYISLWYAIIEHFWVELTGSVGTLLGFLMNFAQDWMYKRNVATKGVEARLYGALFAGPGLAVGCIIFGLTAIQSVHWIAPCVGLVIILSMSFACPLIRTDSSVGIYNLSSLLRLPFRVLWFPRFLSCCSHVIPTNSTRLIFPLIHQSGELPHYLPDAG